MIAARRLRHGDTSTQVVAALLELASLLHNLAVLDGVEAKWAEAAAVYEELLAIATKVHPGDDKARATALNNVATFWQDRANEQKDEALKTEWFGRAEALFRETLAMRERLDGPESRRVATVTGNLGTLLVDMGRGSEGLPLMRRALELREKLFTLDHIETVKAMNNLAMGLLRAEGPEAALPWFATALERARARSDRDPSVLLAIEESWLVTWLRTPGRHDAMPAIEALYPRLVAARGAGSRQARNLARQAADLLLAAGRAEEAEVWRGRAAAPSPAGR